MAIRRSMQTARPSLPGVVALGLFLGACAGGTGGSPTAPAATSAASTAPTASVAETEAPTATPSAPATIAADADLAALLPTTVAGADWTVTSSSGEPELFAGFGTDGIGDLLGVDPGDIDYALATGPNSDPFLGQFIYAIRFPGADTAAIVEGTPQAIGGVQFLAGEMVVTEETVGGRRVSVLSATTLDGGAGTSYYYYAIGDVLFLVQTPDLADAEDALVQLP